MAVVDSLLYHLRHLQKRKNGATAIEYALIAALIAMVIIGALGSTGLNLGGMYDEIMSNVSSAIN